MKCVFHTERESSKAEARYYFHFKSIVMPFAWGTKRITNLVSPLMYAPTRT